MATNTEVEVGVNPMLREEHQAIKRDLRKQELSLDQTQKALALLCSRDLNSLPPEKRDIMLKMTKSPVSIGQAKWKACVHVWWKLNFRWKKCAMAGCVSWTRFIQG